MTPNRWPGNFFPARLLKKDNGKKEILLLSVIVFSQQRPHILTNTQCPPYTFSIHVPLFLILEK